VRSDAATGDSVERGNVPTDAGHSGVARSGILRGRAAVGLAFWSGTVSVADSTDNSTSLQQGPDADSMFVARSPGLAR